MFSAGHDVRNLSHRSLCGLSGFHSQQIISRLTFFSNLTLLVLKILYKTNADDVLWILEWSRCWRRILIGKMYSGHKLVFGLLEKSTLLLVFIFSPPTKKNLSCFASILQNFLYFIYGLETTVTLAYLVLCTSSL